MLLFSVLATPLVHMYISRGHSLEFPNKNVLQSLKIVFVLVAFHLGFYCLPKFLFTRGKRIHTARCVEKVNQVFKCIHFLN